MKRYIFLIILVGVAVGANLFWVEKKYELEAPTPDQVLEVEYVKLSGVAVKVEVVSTTDKLILGLSGREGLAPDSGMLFVFPETAKYPIWMKAMKFSIDIIWIGEDGRVVYLKENATPESFPEVFAPDQPAKYVLEVEKGFVKKNKLKVGDGVEFVLK